jgi:MFS family permease
MSLPRERLVPLIVACGLFMENLDSTVLATALLAIAKSLDVNPLRLNLAITAYLFRLAVFIPVSAGWPTSSAPETSFAPPSVSSSRAR